MRSSGVYDLRIMAVLAVVFNAAAQTPSPETMPSRGTVPGGAYAISDIETIDSVSGNLLYRIPLAAAAGRREEWF